jgi:hypothetical protein
MTDACRTLRAVPCDDSSVMMLPYDACIDPCQGLSVSLLRWSFIAEAVSSSYRKGRHIPVLGEVRTMISSWDYNARGNCCLNKTVFLTIVLWWFFILCIGHCPLPDIFQTTFRKLALHPCSGNWLSLYWQNWIFLFFCWWQQFECNLGPFRFYAVHQQTTGAYLKEQFPNKSPNMDNHSPENGVDRSPGTSCIRMRRP